MSDLKNFTVLVPGPMNQHAADRIEKAFTLVRAKSADAGAIGSEIDRTAVRGIATMAGASAALMDLFPNLEIVANFGVGYDAVDSRHAASRGIVVTNTPDVLTEEVADTAIALLLNAARELPKAEAWLRAGRWTREGPYPLTRTTVRGRTVGIFGMGRIGRAVARRIEAFGLPVAYHNRRKLDDVNYTYYATLAEMADAVDTIISVAPGGASTEKAVNTDILARLGPDGIFVNIGRGSTVDEDALADALKNGKIAAAGLDVFADEPRVPQALLDVDNAVLLPHVGSASIHTRKAMADLVVDNLVSWFEKGSALTPVPETAGLARKG